MDYLVSKFIDNSTPERPFIFPSAPCAVVPNASLSPREIFDMYQKGVDVPHLNHQNEPVVHGGYYPTDPMEALQLAHDYMAALPPAGSTEPQTSPVEPQSVPLDTSTPPAAE